MFSKESKETFVSTAVTVILLGGYAATKHEAFLFVYGLIAWFVVIAICAIFVFFWKIFNSGNDKLQNKVIDTLQEMNTKIKKTSNLKYGLSMVVNAAIIGLLLYWMAFFTALAVILLTCCSIAIKFVLREMFKDDYEQDQSA